MISGVFTLPFSATDQVFTTAAAEGLPEPKQADRAQNGRARNYRLEFIAGPENHLAGVASRSVLEASHSPPAISPLVLHGPAGCGKSHLARGIAAAWRQRRNSARGVVYMRAGEWSPKLLPLKRFLTQPTAEKADEHGRKESQRQEAKRDADEPQRNGAYQIELLIVEDLHLLRQTTATLSHFRTVFDELSARDVPMVFTSRVSPGEMKAWSTDLRARLEGGMVVPVAPPAAEARLALLMAMSELWQIKLTPAAAERLAKQLSEPVPELLVSLAKLCADVAGLQRPISEAAAEKFLAQRQTKSKIGLPEISQLVLRTYGLKPSDLTGKSRRRHIVAARSVVMYLGRELTGQSFAAIGKFCGGRDHTTTLHNCRKIGEQIKTDHELRNSIAEIERELQRM